jgi:hypothetical protein
LTTASKTVTSNGWEKSRSFSEPGNDDVDVDDISKRRSTRSEYSRALLSLSSKEDKAKR